MFVVTLLARIGWFVKSVTKKKKKKKKKEPSYIFQLFS